MWLNLKPQTVQVHNRKATKYKIGITGPFDVIDQHRNLIDVRPGEQAVIKVIPRLVKTTADFDTLRLDQRKCKLSHEANGISFLNTFTRIGCETDCAIKKAIPICKCIPWHYPNSYDKWPVCEMFGAHCFDLMMAADPNYNGCKYNCQRDCKEIDYIVLPQYFPIDFKKECSGKSFYNQHFRQAFRKHFSFLNYKALVEGRIEGRVIDDIVTSFSNGSMCQDYIRDFVALVSIEGPTSAVILTNRDNRIFIYDQIAAVGGNFGLFTGTSMLSFAEVFILLFTLVCHIVMTFVYRDELKEDLEALYNQDNNQRLEHAKLCRLQDTVEVKEIMYWMILIVTFYCNLFLI